MRNLSVLSEFTATSSLLRATETDMTTGWDNFKRVDTRFFPLRTHRYTPNHFLDKGSKGR